MSKDKDTKTALVTVPAAPTPETLKAFDRYGRNAVGFYGDLLKFSGKTGAYAAGQQNVTVPIGTELAAIVPSILAGCTLWKDGEIVDQVLKPLTPDYDPRALRETLGDTDQSTWPVDDEGRPVDPWKEQVMLPMRSLVTGGEYTFSSSSVGGVRAAKALVHAYANHIKAAPETNAYSVPLIRLESTSYKHKIRERGTIYNPEFEVSGWVDVRAVLALTKPESQPDEQLQFEDYRDRKTKKARNRKAV
jgi:hypothetical protein